MKPSIYARIKGFYRFWFVWTPSDRKHYWQYKREGGREHALYRTLLRREIIPKVHAAMRERDARNAAREAANLSHMGQER